MYYRNKLWTDDEREFLWTQKLDEQIRYVKGKKIDVSTDFGMTLYEKTREYEASKDNYYRKNDAKFKFKHERKKYLASIRYLDYLTKINKSKRS